MDIAFVKQKFVAYGGVEALACGIPVVTTRSSGTCDLIQEGVNGSVFSTPGDLPGFAHAIQQSLDIQY